MNRDRAEQMQTAHALLEEGLTPLDIMKARMLRRPLSNGTLVTDDQFAAACHSREFRQHCVHEHVNIGKGIPRSRRRVCRPDGGSHVLPLMLLITVIGLDGRLSGGRHNSSNCCYRSRTDWLSTSRF